MELLRANMNQQPIPPQPHVAQQTAATAFRAFKSLKPPEFLGSADPVEAWAWLKEIEKSFEILGVEERHKTIFTSYMLKGEANYWWESKRNLETDVVIPWDRFTRLFLDKYFPRFMETQMKIRFLELKRDKMTVAEYEAKFTELSRFVPEFVNTEEKKARRFLLGLKQWIQNRVAVLELADYATLVQKASIVEAGSEQSVKEKENRKRKIRSQGIGTGNRSLPSRGTHEERLSNRPPASRTFNMTIQDAVQNTDVIAGMDWLSSNGAQIDCEQKKAKRLLRKGNEAYLAYVIDTKKEVPNIQDIPIVNEFEDVFPENLPGLPPD
ncbi:hypothetical protein AgCh_004789 [Apium graveolens]